MPRNVKMENITNNLRKFRDNVMAIQTFSKCIEYDLNALKFLSIFSTVGMCFNNRVNAYSDKDRIWKIRTLKVLTIIVYLTRHFY